MNLKKSLREGLTEADNSGYHVDPPAKNAVRIERTRVILEVRLDGRMAGLKLIDLIFDNPVDEPSSDTLFRE